MIFIVLGMLGIKIGIFRMIWEWNRGQKCVFHAIESIQEGLNRINLHPGRFESIQTVLNRLIFLSDFVWIDWIRCESLSLSCKHTSFRYGCHLSNGFGFTSKCLIELDLWSLIKLLRIGHAAFFMKLCHNFFTKSWNIFKINIGFKEVFIVNKWVCNHEVVMFRNNSIWIS